MTWEEYIKRYKNGSIGNNKLADNEALLKAFADELVERMVEDDDLSSTSIGVVRSKINDMLHEAGVER